MISQQWRVPEKVNNLDRYNYPVRQVHGEFSCLKKICNFLRKIFFLFLWLHIGVFGEIHVQYSVGFLIAPQLFYCQILKIGCTFGES